MQIINRRTLLAGTAFSLLGPGLAKANGNCPDQNFYQPFGQKICNAFIDPKGLHIANQENSEWCWAATIVNLFAYHNHQVSQSVIVTAGIGHLVNQPATVTTIKSVLNKSWTDSEGQSFASTANVLYSVDESFSVPTNAEIIDALASNQPLLICNMSHAMMVVSVNYVPPKYLPHNVAACIVVDPWPGMGLRALTSAELQPVQMGGQLRLIMQVKVS